MFRENCPFSGEEMSGFICAGVPESGPIAQLPLRARFHWLTAKRSSIIQTSPSHMGLCMQPGEALARIMQRMVLPIQSET